MANAPIKDANAPAKDIDDTITASAASASTSQARGVSRDVNEAAADLEMLRADVVKLSQAVSALVKAQAVSARETVTERATDLYDTGLDYVRTAEGQVRGLADDVSEKVQRNPLASVGIVFGVGYIIGLLRRR